MSADPSRLRLVPDVSGARVEASGSLVHRCPHVPEVDAGTVTITWRCVESTLELHALAAYLATWERVAISHEELTEQITRDLEALDGIEVTSVSTEWRTAGLAVRVNADEGRGSCGAP